MDILEIIELNDYETDLRAMLANDLRHFCEHNLHLPRDKLQTIKNQKSGEKTVWKTKPEFVTLALATIQQKQQDVVDIQKADLCQNLSQMPLLIFSSTTPQVEATQPMITDEEQEVMDLEPDTFLTKFVWP